MSGGAVRRSLAGIAACIGAVSLGTATARPADPGERAAAGSQTSEPPARASLAQSRIRPEARPLQRLIPNEPSQTPATLPPHEAMQRGVLIVVSLPSQRAYVFRNGRVWGSSRVSTGRRGHETPVGTFAILQKQVEHRSTLYDDAPMPYMQRLTWGGVALHAGRVPDHPASHGCIRLPMSFARDLYRITGYASTAVVVTRERITSAEDARELLS